MANKYQQGLRDTWRNDIATMSDEKKQSYIDAQTDVANSFLPPKLCNDDDCTLHALTNAAVLHVQKVLGLALSDSSRSAIGLTIKAAYGLGIQRGSGNVDDFGMVMPYTIKKEALEKAESNIKKNVISR